MSRMVVFVSASELLLVLVREWECREREVMHANVGFMWKEFKGGN